MAPKAPRRPDAGTANLATPAPVEVGAFDAEVGVVLEAVVGAVVGALVAGDEADPPAAAAAPAEELAEADEVDPAEADEEAALETAAADELAPATLEEPLPEPALEQPVLPAWMVTWSEYAMLPLESTALMVMVVPWLISTSQV